MFQCRETAIGSIRYAGRSKAEVIDNKDPLKKGRIKVKHALLGDESVWIPYLTTPGSFAVPDIKDIVYIEADCGQYDYPVAFGNITKDGGGAIPNTFLRSNPTNRGMYTPKNHLFEMDDGIGENNARAGIRLTTTSTKFFHLYDDKENNGISLGDEVGNWFSIETDKNLWSFYNDYKNVLTLSGEKQGLFYNNKGGDTLIVANDSGFQVKTINSGKGSMILNKGALQINVDKASTIGAKEHVLLDSSRGELSIKDGKVALGGPAGELLAEFGKLLGHLDTLLKAMQKEVHVGNLGYPTAPPSNAGEYAVVQGQIAAVKGIIDQLTGSLTGTVGTDEVDKVPDPAILDTGIGDSDVDVVEPTPQL